MTIKIHKHPSDVSRFVEVVQERGDSERDALGFLPRCVYSEAAAQGKLYVAIVSEEYSGHVLFGGRFPHLKIFQLYVDREHRNQSIGATLIDTLAADAEKQYYITMSARVASDLPANQFWERMGLHVVKTEEGGATTGRRINVRRRELNSPTLFTPFDSNRPVLLRAVAKAELPIYALDVNVLLDVVRDRPRAEHAGRLLTAAMSGFLRLFVTSEFVNELSRSAKDAQSDPVLRLAMTLPQFTNVPESLLADLKRELAELIFADRAKLGDLRARDHSDLLHLATTIYHSASGFVTSDEAILRKQRQLRARYGLDVLGPAELAEVYMPRQWTPAQTFASSAEGTSIEILEMAEIHRRQVEAFLQSGSMLQPDIARAISSGQSAYPRRRVIFLFGGEIAGFASWELPHGPHTSTEAWLRVEPIHPIAELVCDVLFEAISRDVCAVSPGVVSLCGDLTSREIQERALLHGFHAIHTEFHPLKFEKLCLGRVVTPTSWSKDVQVLNAVTGYVLSETPPDYAGPKTRILLRQGRENANELILEEFEARFGPVILLLAGRPVAIVPIRRAYADQLLGTANQGTLLPLPEANVRHEKLYLSSSRTLRVLAPGTVILFYESIGNDRGRGAIVAVAQAVRTATRDMTTLEAGTTRQGVLSAEEIRGLSSDSKVSLTFFNQVMRLDKPVGLARLRQLGCADGANLVTARRIEESAAYIILEEGKPSVRVS